MEEQNAIAESVHGSGATSILQLNLQYFMNKRGSKSKRAQTSRLLRDTHREQYSYKHNRDMVHLEPTTPLEATNMTLEGHFSSRCSPQFTCVEDFLVVHREGTTASQDHGNDAVIRNQSSMKRASPMRIIESNLPNFCISQVRPNTSTKFQRKLNSSRMSKVDKERNFSHSYK